MVAGVWTYRTFYLSEAPSLEPRGEVSVDLRLDSVPGARDLCQVSLAVKFDNFGKRTIDVKHAHLTGWLSDYSSADGGARVVDPRDFEHGAKFADMTEKAFPSRSLLGHYPPQPAGRHDVFIWLLRQ